MSDQITPTSLEELFEGQTSPASGAAQEAARPAEPVAAPEEPKAAETPPQATPEAATGETKSEPPSPKEEPHGDPKVRAFQRKAEDETRKRQEYERQVQTLQQERERERQEFQAKLAQFQVPQQAAQQPQQRQQPNPAQFLDPEAVAFLQSQTQSQLEALREENYRTKVEMSQAMMRQAYPDYDEIEGYFAQAADHNPQLRAQLRNSPNPAQTAYEIGQHAKLIIEMGDNPKGYMQSEREKIRQEILAEMQQQNAVATPTAPSAPPPPKSLAGMSSAGPRNSAKQPSYGPTPLDELLG